MHMVDRQLGELMALLKELKLDDDTIIFLCGDNGGQPYFMTPDRPMVSLALTSTQKLVSAFVQERVLYEGGLKVPYLVRWPKRVKANSVSDHMLYYPDIMPTLAELAQAVCP